MNDILEPTDNIPAEKIIKINKPSLLVRIKSSMIDGVFLVILMYIAFLILEGLKISSRTVRGICLVFIAFYEPIFTTHSRTLGQRIMKLRVRNFSKLVHDDKKFNINIFASILRFYAKLLLGWLSLITIHSNSYGRAIHDRVGSSVMTIDYK
jgi:uncharacterized RDD family membrane protein YckC